MRPFRLGECVAIFIVSAIVFGAAGAIGANTRANAPPVWTRSCTAVTDPVLTSVTMKCGKYVKTWDVDHAVAMIGLAPHAITCKAYRMRGPFVSDGDVELEC